MKKLTLNEVKEFWGYSVTGMPKKVKPKGYAKTSGENLSAANVAICSVWVQALPLYKTHGEALKNHLRGTKNLDDVEMWDEFWDEAAVQLSKNPVFAACEDDSTAKIQITYLSTKDVAERLKKPVKSIRRLICERGHGLSLSYRDDKGKWHFHPDELDWFRDERKKAG